MYTSASKIRLDSTLIEQVMIGIEFPGNCKKEKGCFGEQVG